jgi:hypothetical protein
MASPMSLLKKIFDPPKVSVSRLGIYSLLALCESFQIFILFAYLLSFTGIYNRVTTIAYLYSYSQVYNYVEPKMLLYHCFVLIYFFSFFVILVFFPQRPNHRDKPVLPLILMELLPFALLFAVALKLLLQKVSLGTAGPWIYAIIGFSLAGKWCWWRWA